jgi:hypothetical protein
VMRARWRPMHDLDAGTAVSGQSHHWRPRSPSALAAGRCRHARASSKIASVSSRVPSSDPPPLPPLPPLPPPPLLGSTQLPFASQLVAVAEQHCTLPDELVQYWVPEQHVVEFGTQFGVLEGQHSVPPGHNRSPEGQVLPLLPLPPPLPPLLLLATQSPLESQPVAVAAQHWTEPLELVQ